MSLSPILSYAPEDLIYMYMYQLCMGVSGVNQQSFLLIK